MDVMSLKQQRSQRQFSIIVQSLQQNSVLLVLRK